MIAVVLVLALVLLLAAGVLALTDRARRRSVAIVHTMRAERDERSQRAEADRDVAVGAQREAEAERDAAVAAREAAEAERDAVASAPAPPAPTPDNGGLDALWALTVLRTEWSRRRAGVLSTAPEAADDADPLTRVLTSEVEQLRDDAGIPGTVRVDVAPPAAPAEAALVVAATSTLLSSLARWCDAYDLFVHRWEGRIAAVVVCEGFSGPDRVADETSELLTALAPAAADLDVDRDPQGRLRARLSVPAAATSSG